MKKIFIFRVKLSIGGKVYQHVPTKEYMVCAKDAKTARDMMAVFLMEEGVGVGKWEWEDARMYEGSILQVSVEKRWR